MYSKSLEKFFAKVKSKTKVIEQPLEAFGLWYLGPIGVLIAAFQNCLHEEKQEERIKILESVRSADKKELEELSKKVDLPLEIIKQLQKIAIENMEELTAEHRELKKDHVELALDIGKVKETMIETNQVVKQIRGILSVIEKEQSLKELMETEQSSFKKQKEELLRGKVDNILKANLLKAETYDKLCNGYNQLICIVYLIKGRKGFDSSNPKDSEKLFRQSVKHATISRNRELLALSLAHLGVAIGKQKNRFHEAIFYFDNAIRVNNELDLAYYNCGVIHAQTGRYGMAISNFDRAIKIASSKAASGLVQVAHVFGCKGQIYLLKKSYDEAIASYTVSINLDPKNIIYLEDRGVIYLARNREGDIDRAMEDFKKVIKLNPKFAKSYQDLGICYGKKGEYKIAVEKFTGAIKLDPNLVSSYYNRGRTYITMGEIEEAERDSDRLRKLDPGFAELLADCIQKFYASKK